MRCGQLKASTTVSRLIDNSSGTMNTLSYPHPGLRGGFLPQAQNSQVEQTSKSISSGTFVTEAQSYLRAG